MAGSLKFSARLLSVVSYSVTRLWRITVATHSWYQLLVFSMPEFFMHRDGRYAVWFRTPRGEGTGIVELANGIISGSDSFLTYGGSYKVDDDRFTATLTTTRHTAGPPTLFGIDEIELELAGQFKGRMASCSGTARQAPELPFEATLIATENQSPAPDGNRAGKLPAGADSRIRLRQPGVRGLIRA